MRTEALRLAVGCVLCATVPAVATFINFETLPSGAAPLKETSINTSYADWGIPRFTGSWTGYPVFRSGQYGGQGFYAQSAAAASAREWIEVTFSTPVNEVTCDLCTAPGYGIYLNAYNERDVLIGGGYSGNAPSSFWIRGVRISTYEPIARLRWEAAVWGTVLCMDNLAFTPEPNCWMMLALTMGAFRLRRLR